MSGTAAFPDSEALPHEPMVLVLGEGRLGRSLREAISDAGLPVSSQSAPRSRRDAVIPAETLTAASIVILTVPDHAVDASAQAIASQGPPSGTAFVHLSGALGLDALEPLRALGLRVGSFHPFQPFATERPASAFRGTTIGIEAENEQLRTELDELARAIGAIPRQVPARARMLYHAAAVIASSYVVTLAAQAQQLLETVGWGGDEALSALVPLMSGTVENLTEHGIPGALSGPLRRGDIATIRGHLRALEQLPDTSSVDGVYRSLGLAAVDLAIATGLSPMAAARAVSLLEGRPTGTDPDRDPAQ